MFPCLKTGRCPETNNQKLKRWCPCWVEGDVFERGNDGELKQVKGCFFQVSVRMLAATCDASNRPAAEISAMRDGVIQSMTHAAERLIAGGELKLLGRE